jgi:hypothetical protein
MTFDRVVDLKRRLPALKSNGKWQKHKPTWASCSNSCRFCVNSSNKLKRLRLCKRLVVRAVEDVLTQF